MFEGIGEVEEVLFADMADSFLDTSFICFMLSTSSLALFAFLLFEGPFLSAELPMEYLLENGASDGPAIVFLRFEVVGDATIVVSIDGDGALLESNLGPDFLEEDLAAEMTSISLS